MKTKGEFLLQLAIDAVYWGEGADFEWIELVEEGNYHEQVEQFYGVKYPMEEDFEEPDEYEKAYEAWGKARDQTQKDVHDLLVQLRDGFAELGAEEVDETP